MNFKISKEQRTTLSRLAAQVIGFAVRTILICFGVAVVLLAAAALVTAATSTSPSWLNLRLLDTSLLSALGSLLLGLSALYIGARLRKYQEMEAKARARLALNVDLRTRVVRSGNCQIIEVIIDIHNVSRTTWFVPMAYLFVQSVPGAHLDIPLGEREKRCNLADYTATLCQLQPDEHD